MLSWGAYSKCGSFAPQVLIGTFRKQSTFSVDNQIFEWSMELNPRCVHGFAEKFRGFPLYFCARVPTVGTVQHVEHDVLFAEQ